MKREITFKSILIATSFLSLSAFAFVNFRTNAPLDRPYSAMEMPESKVETDETVESRDLPVPDVSVLGRLWDIAQHLMDRAN